MEPKVTYIAELDADIDDTIAAVYLQKRGALREIVCDPEPETKEGILRRKKLIDMGITVLNKIPGNAEYIFVGGALTKLSHFIINHKIKYLVMNGGFVGCNIVTKPLKKFEGKKTMRTFNFNCNVNAADAVLKNKNIEQIMLIGKNVCHHRKNTPDGIWKNENDLFEQYHIRPDKRQHDLLACREGLILCRMDTQNKLYCTYKTVIPYNTGLNGNMTQWGSLPANEQNRSPYRKVTAATGWQD